MLCQEIATPVPQDGLLIKHPCTLAPLRDQGPDALAPLPADPRVRAELSRVVLTFENLAHDVLTLVASNLFGHPGAAPAPDDPIPSGAHFTSALITFFTPGSPLPHCVEILPPKFFKFQSSADARLLFPWLRNHHFSLAHAAVSFLLLALALGPADDDADVDEECPPRSPALGALA